MVAPFPELDRRRARELYRELEAIALAVMPEWRGHELEDELGRALFEIVARLGEHVTRRVDATPRRDAVAFFDMLEVPSEVARPANAPIVFQLAKTLDSGIHAPRGVQVAASVGSEELIFETSQPLHLTPARLELLTATDGLLDTIETTPPHFLELAKRPESPRYVASTFAELGSGTIQIEPPDGLEPGDYVRIGDVVYRLGDGKEGLFTLRDRLENPVDAGALIEKLRQFDPFDFRNLQEHALYVGHADLLNLEAPSTILIAFHPAGLAQELVNGGVVWELFGTRDDEDEPRWHRLAHSVRTATELGLHKTWVGSVDVREIDGRKSRWLRGTHGAPISAAAFPERPTDRVTLGVLSSSKSEPVPEVPENYCECVDSEEDSPRFDREENDDKNDENGVEGSVTVDLAFHNITPLPLTTRFLPFGPEPQRFDTFSIAAPEALTKKGAMVKLDVTLPDASILTMEAAHMSSGPSRVYSIGQNGRLQALAEEGGDFRWQELGHPQLTDLTPGGDPVPPEKLELTPGTPPTAIQLTPSDRDVVVVRDKRAERSSFWIGKVRVPGTGTGFTVEEWREIKPPSEAQPADDYVLFQAINIPATEFSPGQHRTYLVVIDDGKLQWTQVVVNAHVQSTFLWTEFAAPVDGPGPGRLSRMVVVRKPTWPAVPDEFPVAFVAIDEDHRLWLGRIHLTGADSEEGFTGGRFPPVLHWDELSSDGMPQPSSDVRPGAVGEENAFQVYAATAVGEHLELFAIDVSIEDGEEDRDAIEIKLVGKADVERAFRAPAVGVQLDTGSYIDVHPKGYDGEPLALAMGHQGDDAVFTFWTKDGEIGRSQSPVPPSAAGKTAIALLPSSSGPLAVVSGSGELVYYSSVAEQVDPTDPTSEGWSLSVFERDYQNPDLSWEYFNGSGWRRLEVNFSDTTRDFAKTGAIEFRVPSDLREGEVAGQKSYWIRARLVGGDYGRAQYVVETTEGHGTSKQTVTVDTSQLNPPEILRIEAYFTATNDVEPDHFLTLNNLQFRDQTQANRVEGANFSLYEGVRQINGDKAAQRVLYFGFDKPFTAQPLSLFVDAEDQPFETALDFEVFASGGWRPVTADDETEGFHRRGFVKVSVAAEPVQRRWFARDLFWLRARPSLPNETWQPRLRSVLVNAGPAVQAKTIRQELLGSSLGEPGSRFELSNTPVLPRSLELRVRETLGEEERRALDVTRFDELSIEGDWVRWERVDSFLGRDATERVFRLDPETGEVSFGTTTKTPPAMPNSIRAVEYKSGGGQKGNVQAYTITSVKSALQSVELAANPVAAVGGTDGPSLDAQVEQAPHRIRRAAQTLTPPDIESFLVSTSPDLVRAKCSFAQEVGGPIRAAIVKRTDERCPTPPLAERDDLARRVRSLGWGGLADDDVEIVGPDYVRVTVQVSLRPVTTGVTAAVARSATERLHTFLDPVSGGPDGRGWPFARRIWESDVFRALDGIAGLDRVEAVTLGTKDGRELDGMSPFSVVCAELEDIEVRIDLDAEAEGGAH